MEKILNGFSKWNTSLAEDKFHSEFFKWAVSENPKYARGKRGSDFRLTPEVKALFTCPKDKLWVATSTDEIAFKL